MLLPQKIITALNHLSNVDRRITWLSQGNLLATRTEAVLAEATVEETFPPEFTIPDVHEFLRIVRLFKDPVLKFDAGVVRVMSADLTAEATYVPGNQGH